MSRSLAFVRAALGLAGDAAHAFAHVGEVRSNALGVTALETLRARQQQASALLKDAQPKLALSLLQAALADAAGLAKADPLQIKLRLNEA